MIEKIIYYVGKLSLRMRRVSFKLRKSFCEWLNKEFGGKWSIGLYLFCLYIYEVLILYILMLFLLKLDYFYFFYWIIIRK